MTGTEQNLGDVGTYRGFRVTKVMKLYSPRPEPRFKAVHEDPRVERIGVTLADVLRDIDDVWDGVVDAPERAGGDLPRPSS